MLIAHVITRLLRAGSEENTIETCLSQSRAGHDVVLIHGSECHPDHRKRYGSRFEMIGVPALGHALDVRKDCSAVRSLHSVFCRLRPEIVHTHQSKAGIVGRAAAKLAQVPLVVHGVHILPFLNVGALRRSLYVTAERGVARYTDAFINVSEGTRRACLDHRIGRPEQHFVVHSGIDISRFRDAAPPENWRAVLGLPDGAPRPPVVLMLAALERRKRHVEFLEAFGRVVERVPDVRLLLAGDGPERMAVEAAVERRGLRGNVRILGHSAEPERLTALADVTVLTSIREGLPRVTVQSLAAGKPVVINALPGIDDLVRDGVNGIVVPDSGVDATADALAALLRDPDRLQRMRSGAAGTDVSSWSVETMCGAIADIYDRLRHEHPAAVAARV